MRQRETLLEERGGPYRLSLARETGRVRRRVAHRVRHPAQAPAGVAAFHLEAEDASRAEVRVKLLRIGLQLENPRLLLAREGRELLFRAPRGRRP